MSPIRNIFVAFALGTFIAFILFGTGVCLMAISALVQKLILL